MPIIEVPWVKLPKSKFEQLKNGMSGVIFGISPEYVAKILYSKGKEEYNLRDDEKALDELKHEFDICHKLYKNNVGNVPKPLGIERLEIYERAYYSFIMEYIHLPRGDELEFLKLGKATNLVKEEVDKAMDIELLPGRDVLNPANFFYDSTKDIVRIIDFGRWE